MKAWTDEELDLLYNNYSKRDMSLICSLLSNRSKAAIIIKASEMGLNMQRRNINENYFKEWGGDMAYSLGFFFAEGGIYSDNRTNTKYFSIGVCSKDKYVLEQILKSMNSEYIIYHNIGTDSYHTSIHNSEFVNDLILLGLDCKRFPEVPDDFLSSFLRGFFDGDGSVYFREQYNANGDMIRYIEAYFVEERIDFITELRDVLSQHGLDYVNVNNVSGENCFRIIYRSEQAINLFKMLYPNNISNIIYLKRKYDRFIEYMNNEAN
jgi:hypothetical protein